MQLVSCRRLLVLYGSETGTAHEVACRVVREATRRHYTATESPMNSATLQHLTGPKPIQLPDKAVPNEELENKIFIHEKNCVDMYDKFLTLPPLVIVFVAATTGQGEDPENMREFFKILWSCRKDRKTLSGVKFGVIALGDSSYQKFNYSGKRLYNLLKFLGGTSLMNIGLADDQHDLGPDFVVDQWMTEFWKLMDELYPLPVGVSCLSPNILSPPRYAVTFVTDQPTINEDLNNHSMNTNPGVLSSVKINRTFVGKNNPCSSVITKLERVTSSNHFQDVRLIEFDVHEIAKPHKPGDVLMIQPENLDIHVEEFLSVLNLDGSQLVIVTPQDQLCTDGIPKSVLTQPSTIAQYVKKFFDIMSVPKRYFFELLSFFTTDESEREKFQEFSSSVGQQELYDYCNRPKRSILEVLYDFPHTQNNIPFEYLFELIPMIKPRAYSIASSSAMYPGKAQILMAVVNYKTNLKRRRLGVCSNWLITLSVGDKVKVWIKDGTLKFPENDISSVESYRTNSTAKNPSETLPPVIMIGPGTGCAPFRSYIQERIALCACQQPLLLFFGCRNEDADYFFKNEWKDQVTRKELELYTAFSRDQEEKIYVQHRIKMAAPRLWSLINEHNAAIFFAGNAKRVPIDVYEALTYVCQQGLDNDAEISLQYMKNSFDKRYQMETWA